MIYTLLAAMSILSMPLQAQDESDPLDPPDRDWSKRLSVHAEVGAARETRYGDVSMAFDLRIWRFGIGVGRLGATESKPDYFEWDPPHSDYDIVEYDNGMLGIDLYFYQDIGRLTLKLNGGYYFHDMSYLRQSNVTGWYYQGGQLEADDKRFGFGLGAWYALYRDGENNISFDLGVSAHSLRGFLGGLGVSVYLPYDEESRN
jgi:hypothetical protein